MKKSAQSRLFPKKTAFFLCLLLLCNTAYGQACDAPACISGQTLNRSEQITDRIRNATRIDGNLTITDGTEGTDIDNDDLSRFQVQEITGDLTIRSTTITNLNAFNSLTRVGGALIIGGIDQNQGNGVLVSMSGFDALQTIGGRLYMEENDALVNITAFRSLTTISRELRIQFNDALSSLPTFPALRSIGAALPLSRPPEPDPVNPNPEPPVDANPPIAITSNRMLSFCCALAPFVPRSGPTAGYTLGPTGYMGVERLPISRNATNCDAVQAIRNAGTCHTAALSTTETNIEVSAEDGTTMDINLPPSGGSADFMIDVGGGATGFTATETSDTENFVSTSSSGTTLTITYSAHRSTSSRTATITLSTTGGTGTATTVGRCR